MAMSVRDVVKNVELPVYSAHSKLEAMFLAQEEVEFKYASIEGKDHGHAVDINSYEGQASLRETAWSIVEELSEAMNELHNKPWKQTPVPTDEEKFYKEIGDFVHFILVLFIKAGIDPLTLVKIYFMTHQKNVKRQETGY
jgi:hypothetical protein